MAQVMPHRVLSWAHLTGTDGCGPVNVSLHTAEPAARSDSVEDFIAALHEGRVGNYPLGVEQPVASRREVEVLAQQAALDRARRRYSLDAVAALFGVDLNELAPPNAWRASRRISDDILGRQYDPAAVEQLLYGASWTFRGDRPAPAPQVGDIYDDDPYVVLCGENVPGGDQPPTGVGDPLAEVYGAFDRTMAAIDAVLES